MRILVTGTDGYLGCLLAPQLIADGHEVVAVDTGFYRNGWLYGGLDSIPYTLSKDMRDLTARDLEGVDAVVAIEPRIAVRPRGLEHAAGVGMGDPRLVAIGDAVAARTIDAAIADADEMVYLAAAPVAG